MTRPEWVEVGARALADATGTGMPWSMETWSDEAAAVIAAVEPLIRADEQAPFDEWVERIWVQATEAATAHAEAVAARLVEIICAQDFALRTYSYSLTNMTTAWRDAGRVTRAQIAADIEAVPQIQHESVSWMDGWDDGMEHAARIARGES